MPNAEPHPELENIKVDVRSLPDKPDEKFKEELDDFQQAQLEYLKECVRQLRDYRVLRVRYADLVYRFMITWCILVGLILLLEGFDFRGFSLANSVVVTLVGGTTVSVLGLVGFVIKGLFPSKNSATRLPQIHSSADL